MIRIPIAALLAAALAAGGVALPGAAGAQNLPSYAQPDPQSQNETITGSIESVLDGFHLTVRDDRGFVDQVQLQQGTIINPRGLTLAAGMTVTIVGRNAGSYFDAIEIETPYTYSGDVPPPAYYGPGWWYPGYAYGFGPAFCLGLAYGFGAAIIVVHRPFHGQPWDGHGGRWQNQPPGNRRYTNANGSAYRGSASQTNGYRAYRAAGSERQQGSQPAARAAAPARASSSHDTVRH